MKQPKTCRLSVMSISWGRRDSFYLAFLFHLVVFQTHAEIPVVCFSFFCFSCFNTQFVDLCLFLTNESMMERSIIFVLVFSWPWSATSLIHLNIYRNQKQKLCFQFAFSPESLSTHFSPQIPQGSVGRLHLGKAEMFMAVNGEAKMSALK